MYCTSAEHRKINPSALTMEDGSSFVQAIVYELSGTGYFVRYYWHAAKWTIRNSETLKNTKYLFYEKTSANYQL